MDKEGQQTQNPLVFTATHGSPSLPSTFTALGSKGRQFQARLLMESHGRCVLRLPKASGPLFGVEIDFRPCMPWHASLSAGLSLVQAEPCGGTGSLPSFGSCHPPEKGRGSFRALGQDQSPAWFLLRMDVAFLASQRAEQGRTDTLGKGSGVQRRGWMSGNP